MSVNVTVLTDENGVQREYNEVKREASAGERVIVTDAYENFGAYGDGDVFNVTKVYDSGVDVDGKFSDGSAIYLVHEEYHVLEPTSTVIIDGVRYTEEKRKARVGEPVLVTRVGNLPYPFFSAGDYGVVVDVGDDNILVNLSANKRVYGDGAWWVGKHHGNSEYVVLTPITETSAASTAPTVINLAITVNVQPGADVAQAVADAVKDAMRKQEMARFDPHAAVARAMVAQSKPSRDEIVERAKADVAELTTKASYGRFRAPNIQTGGDSWYDPSVDLVEFVTNREKRIVVALIRYKNKKKTVWGRGIAKCAPGDVFNSHIGRAIALRRALGLELPAEYLNAPQPTEVRVGDVVRKKSGVDMGVIGVHVREYGNGALIDSEEKNNGRYDGYFWSPFGWLELIDDSREEVSA